MFWDVLSLSKALLFFLNGCQRLLKNLRHSLTFLGCLDDFWCLLNSHEFSAVLNGSIRFWCVLWHCIVVLSHSEVLSRVLLCSERLLSVPRNSLMFLDVLRRSLGFWAVFYGSRRFWDILRHFEVFWDGLMGLRGSKVFCMFWGVMWHVWVFWRFRMHSWHYAVFWFVLNRSYGFLVKVPALAEASSELLEWCEAFSWVLKDAKCSAALFDVVECSEKCSHGFWKIPIHLEAFT